MRKTKFWLLFLLVGVMTVTTLYYITIVSGQKSTYENGRLVQVEQMLW